MTRERGLTLLEILVTLVVLSVGLMGVAALQGRGLQANQDAYLYSQASSLVYDIAERMRANPTAVSAGNYDITMSTDASPKHCSPANCNPTNLALADLHEWKELSVKALLPGASAAVAYDNVTKTATIVLRWVGRGKGNCDADGGTVAAVLEYTCYTFVVEP